MWTGPQVHCVIDVDGSHKVIGGFSPLGGKSNASCVVATVIAIMLNTVIVRPWPDISEKDQVLANSQFK